MISARLGGRGVVLLLLASTPLVGCVAGHQFSIAMARPGATETVLVMSDGDPGSSLPAASPAEASLPAPAAVSHRQPLSTLLLAICATAPVLSGRAMAAQAPSVLIPSSRADQSPVTPRYRRPVLEPKVRPAVCASVMAPF